MSAAIAQRGPSLYELGDHIEQLTSILEDPELDDAAQREAIEFYLREVEGTLQQKLDRYAALVREFEARAKMRKGEADRLKALADADTSRANRLKESLRDFFKGHGWSKLDTPHYRITVCGNGGVLPLVFSENADPVKAPKPFQKIEITFDNDAIRKALDAGQSLNFARLGERGQHVRIH